jgi:hypothetical protein
MNPFTTSVRLVMMALSSANPPSVVDDPAEDPTPSAAVAPVELTVDIDGMVPKSEYLRRRVGSIGRGKLVDVRLPEATEGHVRVLVTGEQYAYQFQVVTTRDGAEIDARATDCPCTNTELFEALDAALTRAATRLSDTESSPPALFPTEAPVPTESPDEPVPPPAQRKSPALLIAPSPVIGAPTHLGTIEPADRPVTPPQEPRARPMQVAAVATLIAGSAALLVGAGMLATGTRSDLWNRSIERDWGIPGLVLGSAGLVGVSVGGSLLIIDEARCRKRPERCPPAKKRTRPSEASHPELGAIR